MTLRGKFFEYFRRPLRDWYQERRLRRAVASGLPLKIVLGGTAPAPDWFGSDIGFFDATRAAAWTELIGREAAVDRLLAEHVFEHIPPELIPAVLENAFRYLKPGGTIRIAVPDGHNPNPDYIRNVEPGGTGPVGRRAGPYLPLQAARHAGQKLPFLTSLAAGGRDQAVSRTR